MWLASGRASGRKKSIAPKRLMMEFNSNSNTNNHKYYSLISIR